MLQLFFRNLTKKFFWLKLLISSGNLNEDHYFAEMGLHVSYLDFNDQNSLRTVWYVWQNKRKTITSRWEFFNEILSNYRNSWKSYISLWPWGPLCPLTELFASNPLQLTLKFQFLVKYNMKSISSTIVFSVTLWIMVMFWFEITNFHFVLSVYSRIFFTVETPF